MYIYVYPKTRKQRAYIGKRESEKERRETVNTKIVRTPGWVSYRRERERGRGERSEKREKRDHEHKGRRNTGTGAKKRCRKRSGHIVDGASIWPNQRVGHNIFV
jgi:hypothetical protein